MATRIILPKDIVPFRPGVAMLEEVLSDGSYGTYERTFMEYVTSIEAPTTRESEDLETGGDDITILQSESDTPSVVVNAFNASWHALYAGRTFEVGSDLFPTESDVTISATGTYVFTTGEPAADDAGVTEVYVFDKNGYALEDVGSSTTTVEVGQFKYDTDTKTLTVDTTTYKGETMTIMYNTTVSDVAKTTTPDLIKSNEFRLRTISYVQSPSTSQQYKVFDEWVRVAPTGDLTALGKQKSVNTNMSYGFATRQTPTGMKRHTQKIALYTE